MASCPQISRIQDLLDGELSPGEALRVREHAAGCARCRRELELYRRVFHSLGWLPTHDPSPALADRVLDRVLPSRVRRRWIRALGFGYAGASALTLAGVLALVTRPAARALAETVFAEASRRLAESLVVALNVLSFLALSLAGGGRVASQVTERLAPIGRALSALFSQTAITIPISIAVAACVLVLWWMRPREAQAGKKGRHVALLGF